MNLITPEFGTIFWQTITFIVVMIILRKFAWKNILDIIQQREQKVIGAIESAKEAKKQLEKLEERGKDILGKANMDSEKIIKEAIAVRDQIISKSQKEAQRAGQEMIDAAKATILREKKQAVLDIKNNTAELVIQSAELILKKELDNKEKQRQFILDGLSSENFKF